MSDLELGIAIMRRAMAAEMAAAGCPPQPVTRPRLDVSPEPHSARATTVDRRPPLT